MPRYAIRPIDRNPRAAIPRINQLTPHLTINGSTETPVFRYRGKDAAATGWPAWGYGEDLVFTDGGTNPTYNAGVAGSFLNPSDDSVKFNEGDWFEGATVNGGQIGTEDFVFEAVVKTDTASLQAMSGTRTTGQGWMFYQNSIRFSLLVNDGTGNNTSSSDVTADETWFHVMIFADRSGSLQFYLNGVASGSADVISAHALTLDGGLKMGLGSRASGSIPSLNNISYIAMWKKTTWLDTHLQAAVAADRYAKLT